MYANRLACRSVPLVLAANYGFAARELNEIEQIIVEHQTELLEAWHDYFSQT